MLTETEVQFPFHLSYNILCINIRIVLTMSNVHIAIVRNILKDTVTVNDIASVKLCMHAKIGILI